MTHPIPRFTIFVLMLVLAAGAVAQEDEGAAGEDGAASMAAAIREDPRLSTLTSIFEESGLMDSLETPSRLTLFAPSDRAFEKLGEETRTALFRNTGALDLIMRHHLVLGASPLSALRHLDALTTLEGTRLEVSTAGDGVQVDGVTLHDGPPAGGGVIYVVDELLVPNASVLVKDLLAGPRRD